ncbi:MAG: methyltransferase domain-containing protein [Thermodesulfovibrionales bacterium]
MGREVSPVSCGLCGGENSKGYLKSGGYSLVRCSGCGLVYTENFSESAISYSEDRYFTQRNQYVQRWDEFCAIFSVLFDKICRFKDGGTLLDVGAGVGCLASIAQARGFTVSGVEVSEWAARFARDEKGLNIITGKLEDAGFEKESFDVIVINHVLEHVEQPRAMLCNVRELLKPEGMLVIGVPNAASLMAKLKRGRWASLLPEQHRWHFSPATLRKMAELCGLREIYFEARENYPVSGWGPQSLFRRSINRLSVMTDRSEAMLLFCAKVS